MNWPSFLTPQKPRPFFARLLHGSPLAADPQWRAADKAYREAKAHTRTRDMHAAQAAKARRVREMLQGAQHEGAGRP